MAMEQAGLQAYLADARGYLLGEADRKGFAARCDRMRHEEVGVYAGHLGEDGDRFGALLPPANQRHATGL